jgi:O-antigen ligase
MAARPGAPRALRLPQPRLPQLDLRHALALAGVLLVATVVGLLAGRDPALGLGFGIALVFVWLVLSDLAVGVCLFGFAAFLEVLPGFGSLSFAKVTGALLALSWLAAIATARGERRSFLSEHPVMTTVALLFVGWVAASCIWAEDGGKALTSLSRYSLNLLLFPIVFSAIRTRQHAVAVTAVFVVGALLSAAYGSLFAHGQDVGDGTVRLAGAGVDANTLAFQLVGALVLATGFSMSRGWPATWRAIAAFAVGLCMFTVLITLSRSGVIALGCALVAGCVLAGRGRRASLFAMGSAGVIAVVLYFTQLAPEAAKARITTVNGGSGRSDLWTVGWRMVEANPTHGVGTGNFSTASIHYLLEPGAIVRDDFIVDIPKVAHNIYLEVLAELGVPGLVLFLAIVGFALTCGIMAAGVFSRLEDTRMEILARSVVVACFGILSAEFFVSEQYNKPLWLLLALGPALLVIAREAEQAADEVESQPPDDLGASPLRR